MIELTFVQIILNIVNLVLCREAIPILSLAVGECIKCTLLGPGQFWGWHWRSYPRAWRGEWQSGCDICPGAHGEWWALLKLSEVQWGTYYRDVKAVVRVCWGWQIIPTREPNTSLSSEWIAPPSTLHPRMSCHFSGLLSLSSQNRRFCVQMWMTRTNNTFCEFLLLTPSDWFKKTSLQSSWPINHSNGLKTYLMSLPNHFNKCHCSNRQERLLYPSLVLCFTPFLKHRASSQRRLKSQRLTPHICAPFICIELRDFCFGQDHGDHLTS